MHMKGKKWAGLLGSAVIFTIWLGILFAFPVFAQTPGSLQMDSTVVSSGEQPQVRYYQAASEGWVGVYPKGQVSEENLLYRADIPRGQTEGACVLDYPFSPGEYTVVYYNSETSEADRIDFEVLSDSFYANARSYEQGVYGIFSYDRRQSEGSWIGIYASGERPGENGSQVWGYLPGGSSRIQAGELNEGVGDFASLPAGEYEAYLFSTSDSYEPEASFSFSIEEPDSVRANYYRYDNAQPGSAAGMVTIMSGGESSARYYWLYWGDEAGLLEDYGPLGKLDLEETDTFLLSANLEAPAGADRLYLYPGTKDEAQLETAPFPLLLPDGISADEEEPIFSFTVLSDTHVTKTGLHDYNQHYKNALQDIEESMPESQAVVVLGDITDNGREEEYEQLVRLTNRYASRLPEFYYIMGNHDYALNKLDPAEQQELFLEYTEMPGLYYSFEREGYTFLCMSSEGKQQYMDMNTVEAYISEEQLSWLETELEQAVSANPDQPVFVFLHQPLQDTVSLSSSSAIYPEEELREILDRYPQVVFFSGHTHCTLDTANEIYDGGGEGASMVHGGCLSQVWDQETDNYEASGVNSQGCLVEVYSDYIRIRGRDFANGCWMGSANYILYTNS